MEVAGKRLRKLPLPDLSAPSLDAGKHDLRLARLQLHSTEAAQERRALCVSKARKRHRPSQTAAINSLTVYAAKAGRNRNGRDRDRRPEPRSAEIRNGGLRFRSRGTAREAQGRRSEAAKPKKTPKRLSAQISSQ